MKKNTFFMRKIRYVHLEFHFVNEIYLEDNIVLSELPNLFVEFFFKALGYSIKCFPYCSSLK